MIEIIPAINAEKFSDIKKQIRQVEPYVNWVHIDVADGTFTKNTLWNSPKDLRTFQTPLFIEVHLMLSDIQKKIPRWLLPNVRRIIFHLETSDNINDVINMCHSADIEAGVAIHPDTSWEQLLPYAQKADILQTLAVVPGCAGQSFQKHIIKKVEGLRNRCPQCPIEIDGGVTKDVVTRAREAGATHIVSASAIFNGGNIEANIKSLQRA